MWRNVTAALTRRNAFKLVHVSAGHCLWTKFFRIMSYAAPARRSVASMVQLHYFDFKDKTLKSQFRLTYFSLSICLPLFKLHNKINKHREGESRYHNNEIF